MKISIIISVYNSHQALDRQIKYFNNLNLQDTEVIIVDDGSDPAFNIDDYQCKNLSIYSTNNKLAWTQGAGRNLGASKAKGEYLFMTDLDHVLSMEALEDALAFAGDRMMFRRQFGVLLENGELTQDLRVLKIYGFDESRLKRKRGLDASVHGNTFCIKKSTFDLLGGYSKRNTSWGFHPVSRRGDDCDFNGRWNRYAREKGIQMDVGRDIYMFPIGRYHIEGDLNPMGLFHDLSQKKQEKFYKP